MNNRKVNRTFVIASTLLIVIVLIFTGGLNIASFKENYTESVVSSYAVAGGESVRTIEYAVKYGKPLDNFFGIEDMLQNVQEETPTIDEVNIALPDGKILYNQEGSVEKQQLPKQLMSLLHFTGDVENNQNYIYALDKEKYHVFLPIYDQDSQWIGSVNLVFDENVVTAHTNPYMWTLIGYLVILAIVSVGCLLLLVKKMSLIDDDGKIREKRVLTTLIVLLGTVQMIFGFLNYQMFNGAYKKIANDNTAFTAQVIEKDITAIIDKGILYEDLYEVEKYLQNTIQSVPMIDRINMLDAQGQILYTTVEQEAQPIQVDASYLYSTSLKEDQTNSSIQLEMIISKDYIGNEMKNIIRDTGMILLISFLFMVVLTLCILFYVRRDNMNDRKVKSTFIIDSTLLILIVLIFTGGLNIASFKENYTESVVSSYAVAGGESVRNIEYAVKYGKPLDNFFGIETTLQGVQEETPSIEEVKIALPDGKILYNQDGLVEKQQLPKHLTSLLDFSESTEQYIYALDDEKYHMFLPIYDRDHQWIGSLSLVFDENVVTSNTDPYMWKLIGYLVMLAIMSLGCLLIFVTKVSIINEHGEVQKKRILTSLIVILGLVQTLFGFLNYQMFNSAYKEIANDNTAFTARVIEQDITAIIDKGVSYENLYGVDQYLQNTIQALPVVDRINLIDSSGHILYTTAEEGTKPVQVDPNYMYRTQLKEDQTNKTAHLEMIISENYISGKMKNIILDTGTIVLTSFLFMVELTLFILLYLKKKLKRNDQIVEEEEPEQEVAIVRPLSFLLFFGIFLSVSFIPNVMTELYEPILGMSKNMILGLPLSAEMLFGAVATIFAGSLIDKKGWKIAFYVGLLILGIGTLLSGLANGAITFILARGVVGAGYGFSLMSLRAFVNTTKNEKAQSSGLTSMFSGMYAGLNCGVIVGAMLAEYIGFSNVFFVAFSMIILTSVFALFYLKQKQPTVIETVQESEPSKINIFQFFTRKQVFGLFLLIIIPAAISGMFLDYYFPLFAEGEGLSSSNVGRAFLLNGLCIVYLGPFLSNYMIKYFGDFKTVLLGGLLIAVGMLYFSWQGTIVAAFVTIILLGLSDSFGLVAQNNYFVKLTASRELGIGKALGYFDNTRKVGQMFGPMIFGYVLTLGFTGISLLGIIFLVALVLFLIMGKDTANKDQRTKGNVL